jgi:hypothetical protein
LHLVRRSNGRELFFSHRESNFENEKKEKEKEKFCFMDMEIVIDFEMVKLW